ncbi:hypothetical protein [Hymenobacter chitinivorans]|uniref:Uncharacterized protein n=1 Tax=Hymenobacter chitinivorans DSM 11115 TaxID=1121954 RepID=A0A2M9B921_9BACT|nr:hypothetical protein [Hymenobacter chitinivorans]PJJ54444.1 hypothetical protein CLV45_2781 [Hymenobacter chitinivorans DSM 11115]
MKLTLVFAALLAGTVGSAAAQTSQSPNTTTPKTTQAGAKTETRSRPMNTAPATGPTRASRSSSTTKSTRQGSATGSTNSETVGKNSRGKSGTGAAKKPTTTEQ